MRTYPWTAVVSSDDMALALALCARRHRALLMVHTGDGKGKSTPAFELALRGWNQDWSVGVFQFVTSATWRIGEQTAFETLPGVHEQSGAVETLANRSGRQHAVVTGRRADAKLLEVADLVTEMTKVNHPMDAGQKGQRGIEW